MRKRRSTKTWGTDKGQGGDILSTMRLQIWKQEHNYNQGPYYRFAGKFLFIIIITQGIDKSTLLQIVVIIVIWVISLLVIYMLFLICLDPLLNKRRHKASANIGYHEHNNEEVKVQHFSCKTFLPHLWYIWYLNALKLYVKFVGTVTRRNLNLVWITLRQNTAFKETNFIVFAT